MSESLFRFNGTNWFDKQTCMTCWLTYEVMVVKGPDNVWRHPIPAMLSCPKCTPDWADRLEA